MIVSREQNVTYLEIAYHRICLAFDIPTELGKNVEEKRGM